MLRADLVDLAILNLLVDWSDVSGRIFARTDLPSTLARQIGPVSESEILDALILLVETKFVAIDQFRETRFVPYIPSEGTGYFYKGSVRCRALPSARRRLQELAGRNRNGIFLSHISEERAVAIRIRQLFSEALSDSLPVFVSSDYESIPSGDPWYQRILEGLSHVQGIISLLSPASLQRPWINFEAGIGVGADAKVMPVAWRGLQKGDVGMPLGHVQVRTLHDEQDLRGLLRDIAKLCHTEFNERPVSAFRQELAEIEAAIPAHGLSARLLRQGRRVRMLIENNGARPVELLEAELMAPDMLGVNFMNELQPVLIHRSAMREGIRYVGTCLTVHPSPVLYLGVNPLKPILGPGDIYVPDHLGFTLPDPLSAEQEMLSICYSVSSRQQMFGPTTTALQDIPVTAEA